MTFKLKICAASLLALAVFAGVGHAEGEGDASQQPAVQDQPAAAETQPAAIPDEIIALLNDKRSSAELPDDELQQRFKAARKAGKSDGLPDDVRSQLQALADADETELDNRKAAATPQQPATTPDAPAAAEAQPAQEQPAAEQPAQNQAAQDPPAPEQPAAQAQPAALPDDVLALLNDKRGAAELSDEDLRQRFKAARKATRMDGVPDEVRATLQALLDADKAEIDARKAAAEQKKPVEAVPETAPAAAESQPVAPAEPPKQAEPAAPIVATEPVNPTAAVAPPAPEPAQTDKKQVQALDGNSGDPVAEKKARAFLEDATPATALNDDALRTRLEAMRDLLAENEVSAETERALRKKLKTEREVLRTRVAEAKAKEEAKAYADALAQQKLDQQKQATAGEQSAQPGAGKVSPGNDNRRRKTFNFDIIITPDMPRREILRDRRPPDELQEEELRRRIAAYRDVQTEKRYLDYDPGVREYWKSSMLRDRQVLRQRMLADRAERAQQYRQRRERINLDDLAFADDAPDDVFAAEVDDQDIERVIVAPPRKKVNRRVKVDEFATNRQLRAAIPRIEVDTIRFGFNEAFVREEEVDNLDQVASVMERVLQRYPREVFLIEGHTDAVGSDAYNLKLSKLRAEAVKRTLAQYYLIPAKNLKTVGLGERYLKIPTADPEPENRRVSISRVTAFVGETAE